MVLEEVNIGLRVVCAPRLREAGVGRRDLIVEVSGAIEEGSVSRSLKARSSISRLK